MSLGRRLQVKQKKCVERAAAAATAASSKRARLHGSCSEAADSTLHPDERKRLLHLNAEKNRREALKDGFERKQV